MILEDDEYHRLSGANQAVEGDLVIYLDSQGIVAHVGLVARVNVDLRQGDRELTVLSQWGADGEYFHRAADVSPLLGTPTEYWSDRK
jgi:hypothetical protein